MTQRPFQLALFVLGLAGLLPAAAQAQWYGARPAPPAPLYPYELQPGQSYAVEVAPGTYVIHRPAAVRGYPYVRCIDGCAARERSDRYRRPRRRYIAQSAPAPRKRVHPRLSLRPHRRNDPALIEKLHRRQVSRTVIQTRKIVREKPVVIVHRRVVDDPPRVIVRRHYVENAPDVGDAVGPHRLMTERTQRRRPKVEIDDGTRVIRANAVVTILGPDRINIRLYRKRADAGGGAFDKR